jgi:hypothetical protein
MIHVTHIDDCNHKVSSNIMEFKWGFLILLLIAGQKGDET